MTTELYPIAWRLHEAGLSVIPSGGGEYGKSPVVAWAEYQKRQPADEEMHQWVDEYRPTLWGIVTGAVIVFDCDSQDAKSLFDRAGLKPHVLTPRGGCHYYFKPPGHPVKTQAGLLPGLDVRGVGGFSNICGHNHAGEYVIEIMPSPENLYEWCQLPSEVLVALSTAKTPPAI